MTKTATILLATAIVSFSSLLQAQSIQDQINEKLIIVNNGVLVISGRDIDSLDGLESIPNPLSIKKIDLSKNNISYLDEGFFARFKNIETIDLSDNEITVLDQSYFKNNKKLRELDLSNNNIQKITENVLKDLHNLATLHLNNNRLSDIAVNLFQHNEYNIKVILYGNNINPTTVIRINKRYPEINLIA